MSIIYGTKKYQRFDRQTVSYRADYLLSLIIATDKVYSDYKNTINTMSVEDIVFKIIYRMRNSFKLFRKNIKPNSDGAGRFLKEINDYKSFCIKKYTDFLLNNNDKFSNENIKKQTIDSLNKILDDSFLFPLDQDELKNNQDLLKEINEDLLDQYKASRQNIKDQFSSYYTAGLDLGIWKNDKYELNDLAKKVASYEITISEYFSIFFTNAFSYFDNDGISIYHHYLKEILEKMKEKQTFKLTSELIKESIPLNFTDKDDIKYYNENVNVIFNYLQDTSLFEKDSTEVLLAEKWRNNIDDLLECCNTEYDNLSLTEVKELNYKFTHERDTYANYMTKNNFTNIIDNSSLKQIPPKYDIDSIRVGANILLYGVPGVGKSWTIEHDYCDESTISERIVFYPDYTYSDFVGQILPIVDENKQVTYQFTPGPFTRILKEATNNKTQNFILIIEEINRGNASAIFGEIFQLLDRIKVGAYNDNFETPAGTSEYAITNPSIAKYVYGDESKKIRIPSNLSLIGTMNTSDQNVFTLDTAFQRRWEMRSIPNTFTNVDVELKEAKILDTSIDWEQFCSRINELIVENNFGLSSTEDKRLGVHFIDKLELKSDDEIENKTVTNKQKFADKVIKYLWDDAFKFSREEIFNTSEFKTLEQVSNRFVNSEKDQKFSIFTDAVKNRLLGLDKDNL